MDHANECNLNTLDPDSDIVLHVRESGHRRDFAKESFRRRSVEKIVFAVCLLACNGSAQAALDAPISSVCPTGEPSPDATCSPVGLACTYGDSVRPDCRSRWLCTANGFAHIAQECDAPPSGLCPDSPASLSGNCDAAGAICAYDDGTLCSCSLCHGGPCHVTASWGCAPPPPGAGCPPIAPNEGTTCAPDGLECAYGDACFGSGARADCSGGSWRWVAPVCPLR